MRDDCRRRCSRIIAIAACALCIAASGAPARVAADLLVDVELVLAVDISGSIDEVEARQQRKGYIAALADPAVIGAIMANQFGRIAIAYVEWSSPGQQRTLIEWTVVDSPATAQALAGALAEAPHIRAMWTSISSAIDYCVPMFDGNDYEGTRRVIDISGDGPNNRGRSVLEARDDAIARGITINGLPIMNDRAQPWTLPTPSAFGLDHDFAENVIGGPGAFIEPAESFEEFRTAILAKLIREIASVGDDHRVTARLQ